MLFTRTIRRASGVAGVLLAVLASTSVMANADATASLREQVRSGTLDRTHGTIPTCDLCLSRLVAAAPGADQPLSSDTPVGWGVDDLAAALHIPAPDERRRRGVVAIISAGAYPIEESDLATYRAQYGLPACTVANGCLTITDLNGGPPLQPTNAKYDQAGAAEAAMDVDMASASCPSCRIIDVHVPAIDNIPGPIEQVHKAMGDFAHAASRWVRRPSA